MTALSTDSAKLERLYRRYSYPEWLVAHSDIVGRIAVVLAHAHRAIGTDLDPRAVTLAGYLHDIGRTPLLAGDARDHAELSALVLAAEGMAELGELVRRHPVYTVLDPARRPRTLEEKLVYLADRRGGTSVMSLDERMDDVLRRRPEHAEAITRAHPLARAIEQEVFAGLPFAPDELSSRL
ncbi:MAG: HD domain-containing protein [Chloroflexota bacterium]|nr:HD domain-containing protein [Chloroflexota bacterium]